MCFDNCVGVLVIRALVYAVFLKISIVHLDIIKVLFIHQLMH